jgi:hypothetical protein
MLISFLRVLSPVLQIKSQVCTHRVNHYEFMRGVLLLSFPSRWIHYPSFGLLKCVDISIQSSKGGTVEQGNDKLSSHLNLNSKLKLHKQAGTGKHLDIIFPSYLSFSLLVIKMLCSSFLPRRPCCCCCRRFLVPLSTFPTHLISFFSKTWKIG